MCTNGGQTVLTHIEQTIGFIQNKELNLVHLIDKSIFERISELIPTGSKVLVILDSNHTESHVLEELRLYGNLVTKDRAFDGRPFVNEASLG